MGVEASILNNSEFKFPNTNCRIVVVGPSSGDTSLAELANLPKEARILATGKNLEELRKDGDLFSEVSPLYQICNARIIFTYSNLLRRAMCC